MGEQQLVKVRLDRAWRSRIELWLSFVNGYMSSTACAPASPGFASPSAHPPVAAAERELQIAPREAGIADLSASLDVGGT